MCRVLRDVIPPTPPGPEGSNGNGLVWAQWVARYIFLPLLFSHSSSENLQTWMIQRREVASVVDFGTSYSG
ncbi:hypothetical protein GCM10011585_19750 [Edaphobacter dinghuensis]|uniref:Uncharacterized protein n=1 Tax=Edaphobacter dinghuensis TaxID=1560005 RepID=A0A917HFF1_9BACT|nr:hypothetical protein GCM10011585_19750 [Edaphobacter dinghuensis]